MAARSIWNGELELGKIRIGVKVLAAVEDVAVRFHLLDERRHERVKQHLVHPKTGEVLEGEEIHKGYEIEPGTFVLLSDAELDDLDAKPSREISIESFVPEAAIDPVWYERPYYLAPESKSQEYFALADVLAKEKLVGLAHWVMRKREYHGALRAHDGYLLLVSLHSAEEVAEPPKLAPFTRVVEKREVEMAERLVEALVAEFEPAKFKDEHRERVREFLAAKARGKSVKLPRRERRKPARDLKTALEQSLKLMDEQKLMHKQKERKERKSA
jgi:DNA end-binding protein Ku